MQSDYVSPNASRMNPNSITPQGAWFYSESVVAGYAYVLGAEVAAVVQLDIFVEVAGPMASQVA